MASLVIRPRAGRGPAPRRCAGLFLLALLATFLPVSNARASRVPPMQSQGSLRCESALARLFQQAASTPSAAETPRVRVQIDAGPQGGEAERLRANCEAQVPSLAWEGTLGPWAQVTLEITELPRLLAVDGIYYVARPPHPFPMVTSKGVAEIGAEAYAAQGHGGAGVRIAVLDVGFSGAHELLGSELPATTHMRAFYGSPSGNGDLDGGGTDHGTACAEIVHDIAPAAELYLANANSATELDAAVQWLRGEGVDVISHSVGWFFGPGDGTGPIHDIVGQAIDDDIVWVNAAGNQGEAYWAGDFTDSDSDGIHEFDAAGDISISATGGSGGSRFLFILTWDRWPYSSDLAFDLELRENGLLGANSLTDYDGYPYAYRELDYTRRRSDSRIDLLIRRTAGASAAHLRLFRVDGGAMPEHSVPDGSIVLPADGPGVLSVGAYRVGEGFVENFSSRGPTISGVAKPELCAPNAVATATTLPAVFGGTSAACPHAAGAVALILGAIPEAGFFDFRWSHEQLRSLLQSSAESIGGGDPNLSLWGRLRLPPLAAPESDAKTVRLRFATPLSAPIRWQLRGAVAGHALLEIVDATGRLVARQPLTITASGIPLAGAWDGRRHDGAPAAAGPYFARARGDGWAAQGRFLLLR